MELSTSLIIQKIYKVRGVRVMLDSDLALLFQTNTRSLNQAANRRIDSFPEDFMFRLNKDELESLRSQVVILKTKSRGGSPYLPFVFTEIGVGMLSCILNSDRAVQVAIAAMRAFALSRQSSGQVSESNKRMDHLEERLGAVEVRFGQLETLVGHQIGLVQKSVQNLLVVTPPVAPSYAQSFFEDPAVSTQVDQIQKRVAGYFGITVRDLKGNVRRPVIALPRQIAMYLVRIHVKIGLKEIGRYFGGKDHTTVLHACQKIEGWIKSKPIVSKAVVSIQGSLVDH